MELKVAWTKAQDPNQNCPGNEITVGDGSSYGDMRAHILTQPLSDIGNIQSNTYFSGYIHNMDPENYPNTLIIRAYPINEHFDLNKVTYNSEPSFNQNVYDEFTILNSDKNTQFVFNLSNLITYWENNNDYGIYISRYPDYDTSKANHANFTIGSFEAFNLPDIINKYVFSENNSVQSFDLENKQWIPIGSQNDIKKFGVDKLSNLIQNTTKTMKSNAKTTLISGSKFTQPINLKSFKIINNISIL